MIIEKAQDKILNRIKQLEKEINNFKVKSEKDHLVLHNKRKELKELNQQLLEIV